MHYSVSIYITVQVIDKIFTIVLIPNGQNHKKKLRKKRNDVKYCCNLIMREAVDVSKTKEDADTT